MNNLTLRVLSAIVLIATFIALFVLFNDQGIIYFAYIFAASGIFEYSQLGKKSFKTPSTIPLAYLLFAFLLLGQLILYNKIPQQAFILALLGFITLSIWGTKGKIEIATLQNSLCFYILGFIYTVLFPSYAVMLVTDFGANWFLMLAVIVPATDIFAYIGGRLFGKNKLMPDLSPKKTIEGALTGIVGACTLALVCNHFFIGLDSILYVVVTTVVASSLSQTGDLLESLIKRVANVKDSGRIIPGHGGVLDRVDGFYLAAPFVYITAQFSKMF